MTNQNQKNEVDADSIQMDAQIEVSIKKGQFVLGLSLLLKRETRQALQDDQWELAIALLNALNLLERHHKNRKVVPMQSVAAPIGENTSRVVPTQLPSIFPVFPTNIPQTFSVSPLGAPIPGIPQLGSQAPVFDQDAQNQLMNALQMMSQLQGLINPSAIVPNQIQQAPNTKHQQLLGQILNHPNGSDLPAQIQEALLNPQTRWEEGQLNAIAQQLDQISRTPRTPLPPVDQGLEGGSALQQGLERAQNRVGRAYDGAVTPEALGNQSQIPNGDSGFLSQVSQNGYAQ